ncbi:MAG: DUF5615 family PIN-like protein [bacterium]
MELSFIADIHISPLTIHQLNQAGYHVTRITDFLPPNASDDEIVELAQNKKAVIITQDLDFSAIIAQGGERTPSVISLRVGDARPQFISQLLLKVLPKIEKDLSDGAIVSLDDHNLHIRKLPVMP